MNSPPPSCRASLSKALPPVEKAPRPYPGSPPLVPPSGSPSACLSSQWWKWITQPAFAPCSALSWVFAVPLLSYTLETSFGRRGTGFASLLSVLQGKSGLESFGLCAGGRYQIEPRSERPLRDPPPRGRASFPWRGREASPSFLPAPGLRAPAGRFAPDSGLRAVTQATKSSAGRDSPVSLSACVTHWASISFAQSRVSLEMSGRAPPKVVRASS